MLIRAGRSYFQHEHMTRMVDANFSVADARKESVPTLTLYFHGEQHPVVLRGEDRRDAITDLRSIYEHDARVRHHSKELQERSEEFFLAMEETKEEGDDGETDEEG